MMTFNDVRHEVKGKESAKQILKDEIQRERSS